MDESTSLGEALYRRQDPECVDCTLHALDASGTGIPTYSIALKSS
jgi:hypothetical protein